MARKRALSIDLWTRHLGYLRAARTFIELCDAEGIPVLPVKGIVSAHTLYNDPTERELSDVDVRIRICDYRRVGELAQKRGWPILEKKHAYYNYVIEIDGVQVDVECTVGPPHVCALSVEDMLFRARFSNILGFRAYIPNFIDHVVLQIVNVFKDKMVHARAAALKDLEYIPQHPDFDAHAIAERLKASAVSTLGWIVADVAARDLGFAGWGQVRRAIGRPPRPHYARVVERARKHPASLFTIVLARSASDNPLSRLRAVTHMAAYWAIRTLSRS